MISAKIHNTLFKQLQAYVRANNMRPSRVRNMVLEHICQLPQPFTADQLIKVCQDDRISVGTVYNAIHLFVVARILREDDRRRGLAASVYELVTGSSIRMQIICSNCGRITHMRDQAVERLLKEKKYYNFNVRQISLVVYGECKLCRKQLEK